MISEEKQASKNKQSSKTRSATKERRKTQTCVVYESKFDKSHLAAEQKEYLERLFLEAKWFHNYILSQDGIFNFDTKIKTVQVLNKNREVKNCKLNTLSSQMRQALHGRLKQNIINLSKAKKKGLDVGKLKFKVRVWSIPLQQYESTYYILDKKYIRLQGFLKNKFKVSGLKQIPKEAEIANAILVKRNNDYYIMITCFLPKQKREETGKVVGLDFGIRDNIMTSDGEKFNINIPVSKKTKKLQRGLKNKTKFSSNWKKQMAKVNKSKEHEKQQRKDARNKVVSYLTKKYDVICIQDEAIAEWQANGFGKQVSSSAMGGIIADLKRKSATLIVISKWFPSTQLCPECGELNKIPLKDTVYKCSCGYEEDRDIHAAKNILREGLKQQEKLQDDQIDTTERNVLKACGDSNLYPVAGLQDKLGSVKQEATISF